MDDIIDGYDQLIENIQQIVEKFQFYYTFKNKLGEDITFRYKLIPTKHSLIVDDQQLIKCHKFTERQGSDFQIQFVFNMQFIVNNYEIPQNYMFNLTIPVITGVFCDPIVKMTPKEKWDLGLNTDEQGGNIILSGVKYLLPRIFSYPMNKPIIVKANKKHQLVRCEYIKQDDVFYGNSYHTFYAITDKHDIVINFRQNFDSRMKPQSASNLIFVPVILMFYAYGVKQDKDILRYCNPTNDNQLELFLINHFRNGELSSKYKHLDQDSAKKEIAKLILQDEYQQDIDDILVKYIYPFDGVYPYQLGEIVQIMYKVYLNQELAQDKMDLTNKRIKTVPLQFVTEFRSKMQETYKKEMTNLSYQISSISFQQIIDSQGKIIHNSLRGYIQNLQKNLESTIKRSFTSVNSLNTTSTLKKVQDDNKSRILVIQQMKEIVIRQEGPVKVSFDKCKVHLSYFGLIDSIQTPESGAEVGRYLSPDIYVYTTPTYHQDDIIEFIKNSGYLVQYQSYTMPVKVNYRIIGFVQWNKFKELYKLLLEYRRTHSFYPNMDEKPLTKQVDKCFISIFYNIIDQQLCVNTDAGRLMTPIISPNTNVNDLLKYSMKELISSGKITWVCAEMLQNFIIEQYGVNNFKDSYHFLPQGLTAAFNAINPFCINMKSCRSSLFTSQGKQAIQQPLTNHMSDCSNSQLYAHLLQYGPTDTDVQRTLYSKYPLGNIGYATFIQTAFNQEDAMIVNQGFLKRNALSSSEYRSHQISIQNRSEQFGISEKDRGTIIDNPNFMANEIGLKIEYNTPLVGKLIQLRRFNNQWIDCKKLKYPLNYQSLYSQVSNIIFSSLSPQANTKIVRTELRRYPIVGDKLISKNCQKGCIGQILKEYQMPINSIGIVSDFLLSGMSILKRETYGQMIEPLNNKFLAESKQLVQNVSMDNPIKDIYKLSQIQNDKVIGVQNQLLAGPMVFASQCHLVSRKIRARNDGEIDILSRQPASGKKRNGGIRQGNMEEIALESQGISTTLRNQTGVNSSNTKWYYCKKCNCDQVYYNSLNRSYNCPCCGQLNEFEVGNGSYNYSEQVISQTLYSIGVGMRIYE